MRGRTRRVARWSAFGVAPLAVALFAVALLAGCEARATLVIQVRSEMSPGLELDGLEARVYRADDVAFDAPRFEGPRVSVGATTDLYGGVRVGEAAELSTGNYLVRVRALDGDGVVAIGVSSVEVDTAAKVVTVIVNRACRGVTCPGAGSASALACLAGRCVEPACPEDPSACPPPECEVDGECAGGGPACAVGRCLAGACVVFGDDDACESGRCDVGEGCLGGAIDAGVPDAGTDAGDPCLDLRGRTFNVSFTRFEPSLPTWSALDATSCAAPTGETPYFSEYVLCNQQDAPYGFEIRIVESMAFATVPDPTIWGYAGPPSGTADIDCEWVTRGIGATTPYQLLAPGEHFTLRVGSGTTGQEGSFAGELTP